MDNDDLRVGDLLTRREALALLGASGVLLLTQCSGSGRAAATHHADSPGSGACVVRPQLTEGPYFVDELLNRSDIRSDPSDGTVKPGAPLRLAFNVSRIKADGCTPLEGALVDVWHCDALGVYSDVRDPGFDTVGQKFLRGYQVTDAKGVAAFTTIYPGWYPGRTVHIHFKVRSSPSARSGFEFTSQLFFNDALTDRVHAQQPYATKGERTLRNPGDRIYRDGGSQLLLPVTRDGEGYAATFDVALQI
jgi:protocatechuate 3,4-dioxygenase beta subunit